MQQKVQWKTRMDERSCPRCNSLNGKIYIKNQAPQIPQHDHCRCRLVNYYPKPRPRPKVATTGGNYWTTMFDKAYNLPEVVTNGERLKFRNDILQLTKLYPCNQVSVTEWMKEHKMEGTGRNDYINYLCNMKNFVNEKLGKQIYDCSILTSNTMTHNVPTRQETCSKCNTEPGKEHSASEHNPESSGTSSEQRGFVSPDLMSSESKDKEQNREQNTVGFKAQRGGSDQFALYNAFRDYKTLSTKVIGIMCKNHNIPEPNIIFNACPDGSNRSCTVGNNTIYLDPNTYSPRSLLNEFVHYASNYMGNRRLDLDELSVDTIAQKIVRDNFGDKLGRAVVPEISQRKLAVSNTPFTKRPPVRHDTFFPQLSDLQTRTDRMLNGWKSRFTLLDTAMKYNPTGAAPPTTVVINPATGQPQPAVPQQPPGVGSGINVPQPVIIQDPKDDPTTGLMAMFDQMYEPIGNLLGLKARDINESHTPAIISNAVTTLAESNLSDLGSLIVSLFGALTMLAVGTLGKDHIVVGDRKLMSETGANFLWNSMRYVGNPKMMDTVQADATKLGEALGRWNADQSLQVVTTDSRDNRKNEKLKRFMRDRRGGLGGFGGGSGGGFGSAPGENGVIFSKSGPNGPTESALSEEEQMMMGLAHHGPLLFTSDGGKPTRILVGSDGKTIMKTMNKKEDRGADIRGVIGTTRAENPFNRQSPFTFVGGSGGVGEPDRRPIRRQHTGEYRLDDLEGDFIPAEMEEFYRPHQEFPNLSVT